MSPIDTIAAVATGWGHSRWGLIRISGPHIAELLNALVQSASATPPATPPSPTSTVQAAVFRLTDRLGLPCHVMVYHAPRTFTGEPVAELLVPGNPIILERVMARLTAWPGVREAEPGEFSGRAYLNGKMSLDQAEGLAAAIAAGSSTQLAEAERLRSGQTGELRRGWCDRLATLLALVEAGIDFTDQEDVVPITPAALHTALDALRHEIVASLGGRRGEEQARHLPRVALVGPPNAGKSTLFNALLGRRRAVESPIAGTTRDVLIEPLQLDRPDLVVELLDLPGLDAALAGRTAIDRDSQQHAFRAIDDADVLIECRPTRATGSTIAIPHHHRLNQRVIRVRTMADLPGASPTDGTLSVCALDGWNVDVLRRAIADAVFQPDSDAAGTSVFLLPRHRRALADSASRLHVAIDLIDCSAAALISPETVAGELRLALDTLAELTGQISPDDIIGRVFATFCVGK